MLNKVDIVEYENCFLVVMIEYVLNYVGGIDVCVEK